MTVTLSEFAQLIIASIDLLLQILENVANLLVYSSVNSSANLNFSNVWGVAYGGLVSVYWLGQVLQEVLDATKYNTSALKNFSLAINYLGSNATVVFGDMNATSGIAYIQKGVYDRLVANSTELNNLALSLSKMLKAQVELLVKLMEAVNKTFT